MDSLSSVPKIFSLKNVRQKRKRAQKYTEILNPLRKYVETTLLDKWKDFSFSKESSYNLFHGFHNIGQAEDFFSDHTFFSDNIERFGNAVSLMQEKFLVLEEEALPFNSHSFDSICSAQTLHSINDIPGALIQARRSLKEKGVYIASFLGIQTAQEIRAHLYEIEDYLTGKVEARFHPLINSTEVPVLLQRAGFFNPIVDTEIIEITYASLESLLFHLRQCGLTNSLIVRNKGLTSPRLMQKIGYEFLRRLSFPYHMPYELIYVTAHGSGLE